MSRKGAGRGSKARDRVPPRTDGAAAGDAPANKPDSLPPFKPRPRLFYGLLTAVALWVGLLLGLYFFTVFPNRHANAERSADAAQPETVAPEAP